MRRESPPRSTPGALEGAEPSPEFMTDAQAYVAGDIDADEVVRRARNRYGLD